MNKNVMIAGLVVVGLVFGLFLLVQNKPAPESTQPTASTTVSVEKAANTVTIENRAFSPKTLTVTVGTTVTFTNQDAVGHTATAADGSFDTGILQQDKIGTVVFDKPGKYDYYCTLHPDMQATIVVQ